MQLALVGASGIHAITYGDKYSCLYACNYFVTILKICIMVNYSTNVHTSAWLTRKHTGISGACTGGAGGRPSHRALGESS